MKSKNLLPSDIDISNRLCDSRFRSCETETVARNIVIIQNAINPDVWTPFSFEDYVNRCAHRVSETEHQVLETLVTGGKPVFNTSVVLEPGYLEKCEGEKYKVTEKFLKVLSQFVKK
ncbi:MAG: hypothetical protein WCW78_02670 [Candidatus Paceibacterota bacterium]|jgi:hypothetical protein